MKLGVPSSPSSSPEAFIAPIASPKGKRQLDLNKVFEKLADTTDSTSSSNRDRQRDDLPAARPSRTVLFETEPEIMDAELAGSEAEQRALSDGRNDSGVDLSKKNQQKPQPLAQDMAATAAAATSSPAAPSSTIREHLTPLVVKSLTINAPDGEGSEVLWLPTSPPQSPLPSTTPPLRSALKSPSPSRASSRSASPSPKIVHFSPTHHVKHFFLSDPPVDCGEPTAVRYTLKSMIPVQFSNPPIRLDSVRLPDDHVAKLEGKVLVRNLSFDKRVFVRYTSDRWDTYDETAATYVSGDGNIDTFKFDIDLTGSLHNDKPATEYQMALQGIIGNSTYWDNNQGRNYDLTVLRSIAEEETKSDLPHLDIGPAAESGDADSPLSDEEREKSSAMKQADTHFQKSLSLDDEDEDFDLEGDLAEAKRVVQQRGRQGSIIPRTKRVVLTQPPPALPENPFFAFIKVPPGALTPTSASSSGSSSTSTTGSSAGTAPISPVSPSPSGLPPQLSEPPTTSSSPQLRTPSPGGSITPPSAGGPPTATLASVGGTMSNAPPPAAVSAFFGGMPAEHYAKMFPGPVPGSEPDYGGGRRGSDAPAPQGLAEMSSVPSVVY